MSYYRLYCINAAGGFFRCEEFEASDDAAAIGQALTLRGATAAELWQQGRLVKSFLKVEATA